MSEIRADVYLPEPKKFGPKTADHPSVGKGCPICGKVFVEGDYTTLIPLGPDPDDKDEIRKFLIGGAYNARAVEIHWECTKMMKGAH
ncbi:MAG TPA: hypothetical protein VK638_19670 [Edaphobacter sp.]|nr:hypothetical protein [Edaphobacter sp.]